MKQGDISKLLKENNISYTLEYGFDGFHYHTFKFCNYKIAEKASNLIKEKFNLCREIISEEQGVYCIKYYF